jgi:hypothetical protein
VLPWLRPLASQVRLRPTFGEPQKEAGGCPAACWATSILVNESGFQKKSAAAKYLANE